MSWSTNSFDLYIPGPSGVSAGDFSRLIVGSEEKILLEDADRLLLETTNYLLTENVEDPGGVKPTLYIQGGQEDWTFPSGTITDGIGPGFNPDGSPIFQALGFSPDGSGALKIDLFVSGSGAGTGADDSWPFNNTMTTFVAGPSMGSIGSGLLPGIATLFIPAVSGYGPNQDSGTEGALLLFIGESGVVTSYNVDGTPIQSGVMPLYIAGGSPMEPKEWLWNRRAGVDSSGYLPIGEGITIFINGE